MNSIETIKIKNHTVEVFYDEFPEDPRNWDNLGTMVFFHNRYNVGDNDHGFNEPEDLNEFLEDENPIFLYVYGYDHGGLAISTRRIGQFADPWDSGTLGVIYVTRDKVKSEYGWKYLTKERIEKIESYLRSEVEIYDLYLQGRSYGFVSTCDLCGAEDSVWGFYGENWKENGLLEYVDGYCQCIERQYVESMAIKE